MNDGSARTYWCEAAYVNGCVSESVGLTVTDGRFSAVEIGAGLQPGMTRLAGLSIPGLANAHSHAFHRALRSRTQRDGGSFWTWRETMYEAARRLNPDRYFRLARAVFAEMACAGITVVGEFHYVHHQPDGSCYTNPNAMGDALLAAAAEVGIRITLLDTLYLHGGFGVNGHLPLQADQLRFGDVSAERWIDRVEKIAVGDRQRVGAALHSVRAVDPSAMAVATEWASVNGAPLHAHVSEQRAENEQCIASTGRTPVEVLMDAGALETKFTAVHATHLTNRDIELLAATNVCLCPTTERDLGDGIGPSVPLAAAGIPIALGSDSHAVIDLFEEARAVELDERLRSHHRGSHAPSDLLEMATRTGHVSLGWPDAGAIAVGQRADLVTVSLDSVRTAGAPMSGAVEATVFAASASDVRRVMCDGREVVTDGRHRDIDVPAELHRTIADLMED